jgi:hypothetical protein
VSWLPTAGLLAGSADDLAFDHRQILADGVERAQGAVSA